MRVYGLSSPGKSLGWLLGLLFFALVVGYPPAYGFSLGYTWYFNNADYGWLYNIKHDLRVGGVAWHVLSYMQARVNDFGYMYGYGYSGLGGFSLVMQSLPYCAVALAFPLCAWLLWRRLVDYAERPTLLRGVLTALLALIASLVLIFLLDWVGGRVLLHLMPDISHYRNVEVRDLIQATWITAIIQTAFFFLPALFLGGLLGWFQGRRESRLRTRRFSPNETNVSQSA